MQPVLLPCLDANMTHGIIRAWHKAEGDVVQVGEPLFEVETDKVNAEVEAEAGGVLRRIVVPAGQRVPVLSVLAFVGAVDEVVPEIEPGSRDREPKASSREDCAARGGQRGIAAGQPAPGDREEVARRVAASPAARRLARERGVDLGRVHGSGSRGEIVRADVEAAFARLPRATVRDAARPGVLDAAFLDSLRRDLLAFRALSSEMKLRLYREHGAEIGAHVRLDAGAVIVAGEIHLGAGASIGADSTIECARLQLGPLAALGRRTRVHCRTVQIGAALWAKDDVVIGGGGSDEAEAHFTAGDACFFGEGAYLNPCHPIVLGDEVCIGSRAMLFTHSHWQSVLRGYPSLFGPIEVGNHVFIGNQAFVFPGVRIGDGATVMVNSFVAVNVPGATLVGGVPAQVLRHIVAPSLEEQQRIVRERLLPDIAGVLAQHGHAVRADGGILHVGGGRGAAIQYLAEWAPEKLTAANRLIALTFAESGSVVAGPGQTVLDLRAMQLWGEQDELSDEVRECLRRRGLRFRPYAWRYRVGHVEGERLVTRSVSSAAGDTGPAR
jgi:acetyltransferase-like isoleucine patch superfamily enzyme